MFKVGDKVKLKFSKSFYGIVQKSYEKDFYFVNWYFANTNIEYMRQVRYDFDYVKEHFILFHNLKLRRKFK